MALTRRGRLFVALGVIVGIIGAPLLAGTIYLRSIGLMGASEPGPEVDVFIEQGWGVNRIGQELEDAGVIRSAFGFRLVTMMEGGAEDIQAGAYLVPTDLSARAALDFFLENRPAVVRGEMFTIPEGSWYTEIAEIVGRNTHVRRRAFLAALGSGDLTSEFKPDDVEIFEGLLFPSTYEIDGEETAEDIAQMMLNELDRQMAELDLSRADALGVSPYEIITIASMIEAETRVDDERPKVARVIYNRLEQGWTLGIDATVLYAIGERKDTLTLSELDVDSPYNTRKFQGLPPTPIGSPGRASLEAALDPEPGDWMYYVLADCDGRHAFSVTDEDFQRDKAAMQQLEC